MKLYVGEKVAESRVVTNSTAKLNITVPKFETQGIFVEYTVNHPRGMWSSEDLALCFFYVFTLLLGLCALLCTLYMHRQLRQLERRFKQHQKLMDARREPISIKML
ncbi:unnamed protein product [Cylicocyclus nassatus]|uniref:Uncharacterized protein n=1 Tax=Cylicocyclus nassatus TaxID=53992 RepID=A0AA36GYZ4_CYLNA|nr:unnamed protein product [Cylicocyclus nassatus]CAJ0600653.1 unnamed protein product [Cylicocyclus nassatus]